jgi:hypothetical protein
MPRLVDDARLWQSLVACREARLARALQRAANAEHVRRIAVAKVDAARLAFAEAVRQAGEERSAIDAELLKGNALRRGDFERISAAHATIDRTVNAARSSVLAAKSSHTEACSSLASARREHALLKRRCEKYRFALNRLTGDHHDDF